MHCERGDSGHTADMRIVYVTNRLPFGNGETFIVPEIEALLAAGHELLIVPRRSADPVMHDDVGALLAVHRPGDARACPTARGAGRARARRGAAHGGRAPAGTCRRGAGAGDTGGALPGPARSSEGPWLSDRRGGPADGARDRIRA